jgi:acetoin utilization deacetylase AcuC-like enzyme
VVQISAIILAETSCYDLILKPQTLNFKRELLNRQLKIAYDPLYTHPLPEGHRFPMLKYELIPGQLLYEGTISPDNIFSPKACTDNIVLLTHDEAYVNKLKNQTLSPREQRHIGFNQSPALTLREFIITQGTIDCCEHAFKNGISLNVAGGTHHAFADRGEGFCLLNDFAVAANYLIHRNLVKQVLIIDLDVHQGNGTAKIFADQPRVFTFSMHGKHNYPFHKEVSDLDVPLEDGTDDRLYLYFAFYLSGVDILSTDKFGKLTVSIEGCRGRDEFVFSSLRKAGIPCVTAMGGGYSSDIKHIVDAHCNTFRAGKEIFGLS